MPIVNWASVGGFTEGEGCISQQDTMSWAVWIGQANRQVLLNIHEFLRSQGIISIVYDKTCKSRLSNDPQHRLRVSAKRENVRKFLEGILPYLEVKRTAAQDALRCMKLFPLRKNQSDRVYQTAD